MALTVFGFNNDVVSLQDLCLLTVSSYLSFSNVWSIHRLVPYVHCPRIEHIVHSFICDNFMDISHTDQFLALDEKEMHWLLDNQDIKVSEAAMLDSLARWYKHDESQRENAFKQLFEKIHLSVIGKDVLSAVIKKYQLVKVIPELRKYKKLLPESENLDDLIYQENISNIALICLDCNRHKQCIAWMPFISKKIAIALNFGKNIDFCDNHAIHIEKKVHVFGTSRPVGVRCIGEPTYLSIDFHSQRLEEYNRPSRFTATKSPPFRPLYVTCGIYLFAFNLVEGHTVFQYNCVTDEWSRIAPAMIGHPLLFPYNYVIALCYSNRYLYIFGENCEMYDILTNTWLPLASPWRGYRVDCYSGYIIGNKVYIVAKVQAYTEEAESAVRCFVYNLVEMSWEQAVLQEPHQRSVQVDRPAKAFFGKNFAYSNYGGYYEVEGVHDSYHKNYTIFEVQISNTKTGQNKICFEKKLDFELHSCWEILDMDVLTRGLRLLAV